MSNPFINTHTRQAKALRLEVEEKARQIDILTTETTDLLRECMVLHKEVSKAGDLRHRHVWQIRKQQLTIERLKRGITNARADRNMWKEQTEERDDIIAALNESLKARWADITQLTEQINFLNAQAREEAKA